MAKKKRRKAGRKTTSRKKSAGAPGWLYMLMGLSIGLAVAYGVYVSDRKQLTEQSVAPEPREPASTIPEVVEQPVVEEDEGITFDFYDMLPNLDVEVFEEQRAPEKAAPVTRPEPAKPVSRKGIYILQAGSFSRLEDAQRRKAEMALLGVRSDIKKGSANGRTVFRVYTDPLTSPGDVNRVSSKLTSANIETLMKRVSD